MNLYDALRNIKPLDYDSMNEARELHAKLVKPAGSLGELENIAIKLSGITSQVKNFISHKAIYLFGADNGIYSEGVCSSPQEFTRKLMQVYAVNQNAAINILARQAGADLKIYDLGVKDLGECENIYTHKFMNEGTKNFLHERAMTQDTAKKVIEFAIKLVHDAKSNGTQLIGTGEVGMANTTSAAACIMAALNSRDLNFIGRGAGLNDQQISRKKNVILEALDFHAKNLDSPLNILSCVGGLDIAAITGLFIGGALYRIPVIIDGVISIAGAVLACKFNSLCRDFMFASHESLEPAYIHAAKFLNVNPPLKLSMRLGEGTGCAVLMQIISDSLAIINQMGMFQEIL